MEIKRLIVGMVQTNCYIAVHPETKEAVIVDPGDEAARIEDALAQTGAKAKAILLTHGHFDHIWGLDALRKKSGAKAYAYEGERELCRDADLNVSERVGRACSVDADVYVKDGEEITIAGMSCKLIATPGHTSGSCCYYFKDGGFLLSGDTLFAESVGRTDLPTGSAGEIVRSIREKLFVLPDETRVYPGHGEMTTIGHEKEYNPFCV